MPVPLSDLLIVILGNLGLLWAAMAALWVVSVRIKDASIIDIFWGPACALGAAATLLRTDGASPRDIVLTSLVWLWAARLSVHLARRNLGHGEDYRYARMREARGSDAAFARWSLIWVFGLQGLIAWFVSLPVQVGQIGGDGALGILALIGIAIFAIGLGFEAIGDDQLRRFKADPRNEGRLMTKGLWSLTRHPNYFGDAVVWTGLTFVALEAPFGWLSILSPFVMAHFLVNISGKALLERQMEKRYREYAAYKQSTSGFVPLPSSLYARLRGSKERSSA
jgi:steroid 5-alpha reductase family enzyme